MMGRQLLVFQENSDDLEDCHKKLLCLYAFFGLFLSYHKVYS